MAAAAPVIEYLAPPLDWPDPVFRATEAAKQLAQPHTTLWAIPHHGTAAVLLARLLPSGDAEILDLFVRKPERRQGYGRRLMRTLLEKAKQQKCPAVFLEVRASNRAARALYTKLDFTEVSRRKSYYRNPVEDAVVLRKEIA